MTPQLCWGGLSYCSSMCSQLMNFIDKFNYHSGTLLLPQYSHQLLLSAEFQPPCERASSWDWNFTCPGQSLSRRLSVKGWYTRLQSHPQGPVARSARMTTISVLYILMTSLIATNIAIKNSTMRPSMYLYSMCAHRCNTSQTVSPTDVHVHVYKSRF